MVGNKNNLIQVSSWGQLIREARRRQQFGISAFVSLSAWHTPARPCEPLCLCADVGTPKNPTRGYSHATSCVQSHKLPILILAVAVDIFETGFLFNKYYFWAISWSLFITVLLQHILCRLLLAITTAAHERFLINKIDSSKTTKVN